MGKKRFRDAPEELGQGPADERAKKQRRQLSELDIKLAKIYDNLADEVEQVRIDAAKSLFFELRAEQEHSEDVLKKVLRRLVRGLCSSRKAARIGFCAALTELLNQIYVEGSLHIPSGFGPGDVISFVTEQTRPEGQQVSKQEKHDHLLGRIFGYAAIVSSSMLSKPRLSKDNWVIVLDQLSELARTSALIREECGKVFHGIARTLSDDDESNELAHLVASCIVDRKLAKTPEGVATWLEIARNVPAYALPGSIWSKNDPLHKKNRQVLSDVLRSGSSEESPSEDDSRQVKKGGAAQPQPSFVWKVVLTNFFERYPRHGPESNSEPNLVLADFEKLWNDIVDKNLFSSNSSLEKKSWGIRIFSDAVSSLPEWALRPLFSRRLMRCLINHSADTDRFLHGSSQAALRAVVARARKVDKSNTIIESLVFGNGSLNFDQLTKSKTIEKLIALGNYDIDSLVGHFEKVIETANTADAHVDADCRVASDSLVSILRANLGNLHDSSQADPPPWLSSMLLSFAKGAYLRYGLHEGGSVKGELSDAARKMLQARLHSALSIIQSSGKDKRAQCPFIVATLTWDDVERGHASPVQSMDKNLLGRINDACKSLNEMFRAQHAPDTSIAAFVALCATTLLQGLGGSIEAIEVLEELMEYWDASREIPKNTPTHPNAKQPEEDLEATPERSYILMEALLSFLSKPSALLRRMSEQVFSTSTATFSKDALQVLINVLEKPETLAGQEELFDGDDQDNDTGSEQGSLDSDVEVLEGGVAHALPYSTGDENGNEESSDDSSEDSDGGSADEPDENEEELQKLDEVLAKTLGIGDLSSGRTNGQSNEESDSDADMDDEQMMALEPALAKIFNERRKVASKKQDRKDAKENMVNFKNRVLDLVSIYTKKEHANALALVFLSPLLRLVRSSSSSQVSQKAANVLKAYFDSCKGQDLPSAGEAGTGEEFWNLLQEVHAIAGADASKLYGAACSRASLFIAKILLKTDPSCYDRILDTYNSTQRSWFKDGNSKILPGLFTDWINWSVSMRR